MDSFEDLRRGQITGGQVMFYRDDLHTDAWLWCGIRPPRIRGRLLWLDHPGLCPFCVE